MKLVERVEILGIGEYEPIRPAFRARVIEEKKARRFSIGPRISAVFETHDSQLLQIQEMVRTERITRVTIRSACRKLVFVHMQKIKQGLGGLTMRQRSEYEPRPYCGIVPALLLQSLS